MCHEKIKKKRQEKSQNEGGVKFTILSLFPSYFEGPLNESLLKKAREKKLIDVDLVDIRDYSKDKHKRVDDRPYGGGPGMVMQAAPVVKAIRDTRTESSTVIYLSPKGEKFTAKAARNLAKKKELVFLCGHYEGVDERAIVSDVDLCFSIGDYVLTSGCPAALVMLDAISRFIPGVVGNQESVDQDSFEEDHLLDWPHYTRPVEFEGVKVPEVLLSGHHEKIVQWRKSRRNRHESVTAD